MSAHPAQRRRFRRAAWPIPVLLLIACGELPAGPVPGTPVTETITPAGGTVTASDRAGNVLTIAFPPAAVPAPLAVTLTPLEPPQEAWAAFEIAPAGTALAAPAILTLEAAPGTDVVGSSLRFGLGVDGSPLPTGVAVRAGRLEAETTFLGFPAEEGALRRQQGGLDPLVAMRIRCDIELTSLEIRFETARNYPFSSSASAKRLADQIRAFRADCSGLEPNYDALIARIETESCLELADAEADAAVSPPTTRDQLLDLAREVLRWAAAAEASTASCTGGWLGSVEALFEDFIARFRARVQGPAYASDYNDLWNDLRLGALPLKGDTMALDLGGAQSSVDELIADLIDGLREAGYRGCTELHSQDLLANLYTGGDVRSIPVAPPPTVPLLAPQGASSLMFGYARFAQTAIEEDMQLCGSRVTLDVWMLTESFPDESATVRGGDSAGDHEPRAETRAPVEGQLQLGGDLLAMDCPGGYDAAAMVVKLDGTEVERLTHSGGDFLASLAELDVETMLGQAGIDGENQSSLTSSFPLELVREGAPCGGDYGPSDYTVFTFDLNLDPAPDVTANPNAAPTSIPAKISTPITFTLPFQDVGENVAKIIGRFSLAGNSEVFTQEWGLDDTGVSGFGGSSGNGSIGTQILVYCSEAGKNPITAAFRLEDEFGQTSDERSTTLTVNYSGCSEPEAAAGAASFEMHAGGAPP